jgi:hypothetical protein
MVPGGTKAADDGAETDLVNGKGGGAKLASERAKSAAREAYEAWQTRNRLPDETDADLMRPIPPPLQFDIDMPELLDEDMAEVLAMPEVCKHTCNVLQQPDARVRSEG